MKIIECQQMTPEWWYAKKGIPSASEFSNIITAAKGLRSTSMRSYACQLIAESVSTEVPDFTTGTKAMRNGVDLEAEARDYYSMIRATAVQQVGFITTEDGRFGCSPDGLVEGHYLSEFGPGGVEIKCPTGKVHLEWLLNETLPDDHKAQVHGNMVVTCRNWWEFASYCPPFKTLIVRVYRDEFTAKLEGYLEDFWRVYQECREKVFPKTVDGPKLLG